MSRSTPDRSEIVLWSVIVAYTAAIYATLALVSRIRVLIVEHFGPHVWNYVYGIFALVGLLLVLGTVGKTQGRERVKTLGVLTAIGITYAYYLSSLRYAVERIHFLEYGVLGALIYVALSRRTGGWTTPCISTALVYLTGLGDEAIQWALPNRVGEIGDGVTNLVSGILGIAAMGATAPARSPSHGADRRSVEIAFVSIALGILSTSLFLVRVHGFGSVIESRDLGRFFSAFPPHAFANINHPDAKLTAREQTVYETEAIRHLHQREFYFTNDFAMEGGGYYRSYSRCHLENGILQQFYPRFLERYAASPAGSLLVGLDPDVASRSMQRPVHWPDSLSTWVADRAGESGTILESRVKSTIITGFRPLDLWFYTATLLVLTAYARRRYMTHARVSALRHSLSQPAGL